MTYEQEKRKMNIKKRGQVETVYQKPVTHNKRKLKKKNFLIVKELSRN